MPRLIPSSESGHSLEFETPESSVAQLENDARWQLARRVAGSKKFAKSRFLSDFILYVCEKYLLDRVGEITEQRIGEQVFRRPVGYSPSEDNIVRNYARLLRQRLDEYFTTGDGVGEPFRLAIPRGGYVPIFIEEGASIGQPLLDEMGGAAFLSKLNEDIVVASTPMVYERPSDSKQITQAKQSAYKIAALLVLCAVLSIALAISLFHKIPSKLRQTATDRFWSNFFDSKHDTLLVPADSGLAIYINLTHRSVSLGEYVRGDYAEHPVSLPGISPTIVSELGTRRYTSVVDLHLVSTIAQLPYVVRDRFKVRYAREIQLDDLKESNVILLGSLSANPWVELFQKDTNFQFEHHRDAEDLVIHNLHPEAGEKSFYQTDQTDPAHTTYGIIAAMPNLSGSGHVLLIEGINMAGTEAAADYLFSEASRPLLNQILAPNGELNSFEVLIETSNIGANAPRPRIISKRIYRQPTR